MIWTQPYIHEGNASLYQEYCRDSCICIICSKPTRVDPIDPYSYLELCLFHSRIWDRCKDSDPSVGRTFIDWALEQRR